MNDTTTRPANHYLDGLHPRERGYTVRRDEFSAIDARICQRGKCPACGHEGLGYEAHLTPEFARNSAPTGPGYAALAVCPACGYEEEF